MMGQVPMAAAHDRLFPAAFGRMSGRGVPALGMVISAALATGLLLFEAWGAPGVRAFYSVVVSLSTMAAVIPYAFCALAVSLIAAGGGRERVGPVELVGFAFALFTIYGCGPNAVLGGLILLLLGIPVYAWQRRRTLQHAQAD